MWSKVDDNFLTHRKKVSAGQQAILLWLDALVWSNSEGTDGLVAPEFLKVARGTTGLTSGQIARATARLVDVVLWHDVDTIAGCPRCHKGDDSWDGTGDLVAGTFYFHDWREYQLEADGKVDPIAREREKRRKALSRAPDLRRLVRERDQDLCRYCGVLTRWDGDKRSRRRGTYDHLDPFGRNELHNLVVACGPCNARKKDRTPDQAGMELRPVPGQIGPRSDPDPKGPRSPGGTGRVGSRSDLSSDRSDEGGST